MRRSVASLTLVGLLVASLALAPMSVAASHDEGFYGINEVEDEGPVSNAMAVAEGVLSRVVASASSIGSDPTPADQAASDTMETFNQHRGDWITYVNTRGLGSENHQVLELTFEVEDETETIYLVSDYNTTTDEYDSAEMVNATDREPDYDVTLSGVAAENADEELEEFHSEFVSQDRDPTSSYVTKMSAKYVRSDHVTGTLIGDNQ